MCSYCAGRTPSNFSHMQVEGEVHRLGWDDIRLTADESNAIAMIKAKNKLPADTLSSFIKPPMDGLQALYCSWRA